jgi:hypothetical protein
MLTSKLRGDVGVAAKLSTAAAVNLARGDLIVADDAGVALQRYS